MSAFEAGGSPRVDRRDSAIALLLAAATAAWWATFIDVGFAITDEGIADLAGMRLRRGERPFADFFLFYFPGYALWLAAAFEVMGESILAARIAWGVFAPVRTVAAYLVARRLAPRGPALGAAAIALMLPGPAWKVPVGTLYLLGLLAALRLGERPSTGRAVAAGLATAFAAWFRWDAALATALAAGACGLAAPRTPGSQRGRLPAREVGAFAAAALAGVAPGLLWVLATPGAFAGMAEHFAYHGSSLDDFSVPWPSPIPGLGDGPSGLPEALRRILYALPVVGFVALPLQRFGRPGRRVAVAAVWVVGLVAFLVSARRAAPSHIVQLLPVSLLPLFALRPGRAGRLSLALLGLLALAGLGAELAVDSGARRPSPILRFLTLEAVDLPRAGGIRAPPAEAREIEAVVAEVVARTVPGDRIAALPAAALVPFLADRPPSLRYDAVYPGLLDDPRRAEEAEADLAAARLVVLYRATRGFAGTGSPALADYAPGLWRALGQRFRAAKRIGRFTLLEPREGAPDPR